jgi:hypothetical protein
MTRPITVLHVQEIIIKIIKENYEKNIINQFMMLGKAYNKFETEQRNQSLLIGNRHNTASTILNTRHHPTSTNSSPAPALTPPAASKPKTTHKCDASKDIHTDSSKKKEKKEQLVIP